MKKQLTNRLAWIAVLATVVLIFPANGQSQTNFDAQIFYVIVQGDTNSCQGLITISYDPGQEGTYLSVGAQNEKDAQLFDIIVSNKFLPPASFTNKRQSISLWFDLIPLGVYSIEDVASFIVFIHLLNTPGCYPFPPSSFVDTKIVTIQTLNYNAQGDKVNESITDQISESPQPTECKPSEPVSEVYYRGCEVPNLDLDDSKYPDTATYAGDVNACVPTSTSNSLLWLDKEFNIYHGFPPDHHALVDTLSHYMKRERDEGTYNDKFIRGKLDYINRYQLPLRVRFQSRKDWLDEDIVSSDGKTYAECENTGYYPTWDFLKEAMKESCDVEINYRGYIASKNKWYGHSVVVTGVEEYQPSGKRYLTFKHDTDQDTTGGTIQESDTVFVDEYGRLRYAGRSLAYIKDIVVECPADPLLTSVKKIPGSPENYQLFSNYPNPFNPITNIEYVLPQAGQVTLIIYSILGQKVRTLVDEEYPAGHFAVTWDGKDDYGNILSSGTYFYQVQVRNQGEPVYRNTEKLLLLK